VASGIFPVDHYWSSTLLGQEIWAESEPPKSRVDGWGMEAESSP
jgi:hypothetical protein